MEADDFSNGHNWVFREVEMTGETFLHRQCVECGRDFLRANGKSDWRAVRVELLAFEFLDDATNQRWLAEGCTHSRSSPQMINIGASPISGNK
jgi:hypothetical protein